MNTHAYWAAWTTARQTAWTEQARAYEADTWDAWADYPERRESIPRRTRSLRRRRKRVRVRRHFSWRHVAEIPAYTREVATRSVTFACQDSHHRRATPP